MLPDEYRLSDLRSQLGVSNVPSDERSIHTLFAVLINDVDQRADVHQSIKPEIMEGLAQAWLYFAETETGVDVEVEQHRHGVDTTVDDPADDRPASSIPRNGAEPSIFDERLRDIPDHDVSLGEFERDMRRLDDLRRKYSSPGLNTFEGNEARDLREKYDLEHHEWWQRAYLAETETNTDQGTSTTSAETASASR